MSHPTRPALTRLAAACAAALPAAVVAQAPAPAGADEDPIWVCTAETIPPEELEEGATADISCDWVYPDEMGLMQSGPLVGTHYNGTSGAGAILNVYGSCGHGLAFSVSDPWNNAISSTRQRTCGVIKHFDNANFSGDLFVHDGSADTLWNLGTMNNRTSSITYD